MATAIQGAKLKRINWGKGEPLERLTKAVEDWDAKTGPHFEADKTMSLLQYSKLVGIHYQTLSDYASRSSASLSRINLVCWRSLCRLPQRRPLQRRPLQRRPLQRRPPQVRRPPQCRQPWCRQPRRRPSHQMPQQMMMTLTIRHAAIRIEQCAVMKEKKEDVSELQKTSIDTC